MTVALGYLTGVAPRVSAQTFANANLDDFIQISRLITGRGTLPASQASRLFNAMMQDDAQLSSKVQALLRLIEERKLGIERLQQSLDEDGNALSEVPQKIATAWFLGVVGEAETARCLEYERALNAVIVADVLMPPTYAYGPYGSWARKPT